MTEGGVHFVSMAAVMKSPMEGEKKYPLGTVELEALEQERKSKQPISNIIKTP